jgi:hypothetical protein
VRFLISAAFLLCASVAVRLTMAERIFIGTTEPGAPASQTPRALRLLGSAPNAAYFERLAERNEDGAAQFLGQALEANPRLTSARIRLGLLQEQRGDFGSAERTLLEAARYDRQYLPAWTLANYYFRHQNQNAFWQWSRAALPLDSGDPRPLLRLANLVGPDVVAVLDRLQGGEQIAYPYMDLLIGAGRLDAAQQVARVVLRAHEIRKNSLIDLSTRQLKAGNVAWALEIWNALYSPLDPEQRPVLAQMVFEDADGEGFHLRPVSNSRVGAEWRREGAGFSFQGEQADACALFEQPIPAPQHPARYRLRYEYKSSATGARWNMAGRESPALPLQVDWRPAEWTISIEPGTGRGSLRLLPLQLLYRREPGTTPARGELDLRNLQLQIL